MRLASRLRGAWGAARLLHENRRAARHVVRQIERDEGLDSALLRRFLSYSPDALLRSVATRAAAITTSVGAVTALVAGVLFAGYPAVPDAMRRATPGLALSERLHAVFNYLHSIHNSSVEGRHLVDHIPDLGFDLALLAPLYGAAVWAFIHFGWRRNLARCQEAARTLVAEGRFHADAPLALRWRMRPGHTALIAGDGDPLADEYVRRRDTGEVLLYATRRQAATDVWVELPNDASISDLERAFAAGDFARCGCLILLPVQAQHMVFPPADAYDITPEKLDDMIRSIRALAARRTGGGAGGAEPVTIVVVGDRRQRTVIRTYDASAEAAAAEPPTEIALGTIERDSGGNLIVIDPTDALLDRVTKLAGGARIDFRSTEESRRMYERQFRERLDEAGYRVTDPGRVFRMGYNITDDPTVADPLNSAAVILTASARDALRQKGYPPERILYVPELVIDEIARRLPRGGSGSAVRLARVPRPVPGYAQARAPRRRPGRDRSGNHTPNRRSAAMTEPVICQKKPYVIQVEPGTYAWCRCGRSQEQPYCDGSHKGTGLAPLVTKIDAPDEVAWCGCKLTRTPPFCDGTHKKL